MQKDLVYDVGVNNGDDTAYYLRKGFRVVGIEANPDYIAVVEDRFPAEIRDGRLVLLNVAIAPEDGVATFYLSDGNRGVWSSLDPSLAARDPEGTRKVSVPARRFRGLLEEYGVPYYLKVDIEGADRYCIADIDPADAPAFVSFEASEGQLSDLFLLARAGYTRFKLIDQLHEFVQAWPPELDSTELARTIIQRRTKSALRKVPVVRGLYDLLRRRERAREMKDDTRPREFPISSSGPMGEDTDGPWRTIDDATWAWLYFVRFTTTSTWYDIHAAR